MKTKRPLMLIGSICLSLVLAVLLLPACAPAAPTGEGDCSDVEAELAAEEKKTDALEDEVSDLEKEVAALKKPAEVQEWEPASWTSAGPMWDALNFIADSITRMSDGRIVVSPTAAGAICPVKEQLDFVEMGNTEAMFVWSGYFPGQLSITYLEGDAGATMDTLVDIRHLYEEWEGGRITELIKEEYVKYGDIRHVAEHYYHANMGLWSAAPMYGLEELTKAKLRSSEVTARVIAHLGGSTVWLPADEIYTAMATGVVDGCTFGNAAVAVANSFHEVTKYWVRKPLMSGACTTTWICNGTVWDNLPDDLKDIVELSVKGSIGRSHMMNLVQIDEAWQFAEDYGIEIIEWSDADSLEFKKAHAPVLEDYREHAPCAEYLDILTRWMVMKGYWTE